MTDKNIEQKFKDTAQMLKQLHALRNITIAQVSGIIEAIESYENELAHLSSMLVQSERLDDNLRIGE